MSVPQNKRGYRKIVVNGVEYNWKRKNRIMINPVAQKDNKLAVDYGYVDVWLMFPVRVDYIIVTPVMVREIILFALEQGWDVSQRVGEMRLVYRDEKVSVQ